jgi:hypothetical protein
VVFGMPKEASSAAACDARCLTSIPNEIVAAM